MEGDWTLTKTNFLLLTIYRGGSLISFQDDLSFVIDLKLYLYEHQSTFNPNLPLRDLFYIADLLSNMTKTQKIYGRKAIQIPTPHFVVFYNGTEKRPEQEKLRLSDLFSVKEAENQMELIVTVLNINIGNNDNLLNSCKTLKDYCEYNQRIRNYLTEMPLEEAVERSITECIREGILSEFLKKNRAEAKKMSIYEFDEELFLKQEKQDSFEEGVHVGMQKGIKQGVEQGIKQGVEQGMKLGELTHLKMLIEKKLAKGKDTLTIAEELEEDVTVIEKIVNELTDKADV